MECECPSGCLIRRSNEISNFDATLVQMICSTERCPVNSILHETCLKTWEISTGMLISSGRELKGHMLLNCKCGRGRLQRENLLSALRSVEDKRRKKKKSSNGISQPQLASKGGGGNGGTTGFSASTGSSTASATSDFGARARGRTMSLGSALKPNSSHNNHNNSSSHNNVNSTSKYGMNNGRLAAKKSCGDLDDVFNDLATHQSGSIFQRRESLGSLFAIVPKWKCNGIHIKLEDDCPQGNDETRIFLLTTFGDRKMREIPCIFCERRLPIYDKYPLLDGTLFLSNIDHSKYGVTIKYDGQDQRLYAICAQCLCQPGGRLTCRRCSDGEWFVGDRLILGTLYTFDVLNGGASRPCRCAFLAAGSITSSHGHGHSQPPRRESFSQPFFYNKRRLGFDVEVKVR